MKYDIIFLMIRYIHKEAAMEHKRKLLKSFMRLFLAVLILSGFANAQVLSAKAKELEEVIIYYDGTPNEKKPYGTNRIRSSVIVATDYSNWEGVEKGYKWTKQTVTRRNWDEEITKEKKLADGEKFDTFAGSRYDPDTKSTYYTENRYYLYVALKLSKSSDYEMPTDISKYSVKLMDIPDCEAGDVIFVEPIGYNGDRLSAVLVKIKCQKTFQHDGVEVSMHDPEEGKRVGDLKVHVSTFDLKTKNDLDISQTWHRCKVGTTNWQLVSPDDVFEKDYVYVAEILPVVSDWVWEQWKELKNHREKSRAIIRGGEWLKFTLKTPSHVDDHIDVNYFDVLNSKTKTLYDKTNVNLWTSAVIGNEISSVSLTAATSGGYILTDGTLQAANWDNIKVYEKEAKTNNGIIRYQKDTSYNPSGEYWRNGVCWKDVTSNRILNSDDISDYEVIPGREYQMKIRLTAAKGNGFSYKFAKKVRWTLDGVDMEPVEQTDASDGITLVYTYKVPTIPMVTIDLPKPLVEGDLAPYTAVMGDTTYRLSAKKDDTTRHNGMQWRSSDGWFAYDYNNGAWKVWPGSGYMVDYILEPTGNNIFPGDEYLAENSTFMISTEGIKTELISCKPDELRIRTVYPVWSKITDLTFSIGRNLQAGLKPEEVTCRFYVGLDHSLQVEGIEDLGYDSYSVKLPKSQWLESSDGEGYHAMSTDTFVGGTYYAVKALPYIKNLINGEQNNKGLGAVYGTNSKGIENDTRVIVNGSETPIEWSGIDSNHTIFLGQLEQGEKINIESADVTGVIDKIFTGSEILQNVTVQLDGYELTEGTDYKVTYENNIQPGEATVKITGEGNYTGTITVTFVIRENYTGGDVGETDLAKAVVTGIVDKTYTGSEIRQKITVTLGGKELVEGTDYTVKYEKNIEPGEATMTISGMGTYKGSVTRTFQIKKTEDAKTDPKGDGSKTDDGQKSGGDKPADGQAEPGAGVISEDGRTLTDPDGNKFAIAETLKPEELKKDMAIADKATGSKYRITKMVFKKGKFKSGTAEYVGPYNREDTKATIKASVKIAGRTFQVTAVAANAGRGCSKLTKVVIGKNVTKIGSKAFKGCGLLKTIQIKSKKLKSVGKNAFKGIHKKAVIKLPKLSKKQKNKYKKLLKKKGQGKGVKIK